MALNNISLNNKNDSDFSEKMRQTKEIMEEAYRKILEIWK